MVEICICHLAATAVVRCGVAHRPLVGIKGRLRVSHLRTSTCMATTTSTVVGPAIVMTSLAWAMAREATVTEAAADETLKVAAVMIATDEEMAAATTEIETTTTEEAEAAAVLQLMKAANTTTTTERGEKEEMKVDISHRAQVTTTREIDLPPASTTDSRVHANFNQT